MKIRPKQLLSSVILLLALSYLTSCSKESLKPARTQSAGAEAASVPNSQVGTAQISRIAEREKPYEWTREQIKRHHAKLVLAELPDYIGEVWGCGDKDP